MKPYPHTYRVSAQGAPSGMVPVSAQGVPAIATAPPPDFDGPEGTWSPETLLVTAVANCFILTFRGVARAANLPWEQLECRVEGVLERSAGVTRFTRFTTRATLTVSAGADQGRARQLLERAETACLIANSLSGERHLEAQITGSAR